jgi:hypothetical protein
MLRGSLAAAAPHDHPSLTQDALLNARAVNA